MLVKVTEHAQLWRSMENGCQSIKVRIHIFCASCERVFKILTFEMFNLENLRRGRRVQQSQWYHSVANINLFKSINKFSICL